MKRLRFLFFLFLIFSMKSGNALLASFDDNVFAFCRINLEKSGNQDILGLVNAILEKRSKDSFQNEAVLKAVSIVSIRDVKAYAFPENKNGQSDYLIIIDLADKFTMTVAGKTVEFEVKDKDSLAAARTAALERLIKESLGGDKKLKSIELLKSKIYFNEEKENRGKLSSFTVMQGKVLLASSKMAIRGFLKEGFRSGEKIERFREITGNIPSLKGGVLFLDNKNGDVGKFAGKMAAKKNIQMADLYTQIIKAGLSFEQLSPEQIKAGIVVLVPKKLSETAEKEMQSLAAYGDIKIKKENGPDAASIFISAEIICNKDSLSRLLL